MGEREVEWSALPIELLPLIGKTIQARIDAVRFRSVSGVETFLSQSTIYGLEPPNDNPNPSTSSSKSWLVKVEEFEPGRVHLLNPLSSLQIKFIHGCQNRDLECKAYKLEYSSDMNIAGVNKLVLFPNTARTSCVEHAVIFALFHEGKLGSIKYGDENWTQWRLEDILLEGWGTVFWIDSSMKLIQFSPPLCSLGNQKDLVESCGELYVVDRFFDRERRRWHFDEDINHDLLYKLDQEWGHWVMFQNLGDQVFILGNDCSFSVSTTEFSGCKGNCIYFTDEKNISVFYSVAVPRSLQGVPRNTLT
ncbi:hypothetical protein ACB092_02G248400 [Castanea dentata]